MATHEANPTPNPKPIKPQQYSPSPSPLSSPTHEFSFTITLHPSPNPTIRRSSNSGGGKDPAAIALDLAPADDIFFHGQLLPLHLLSRPPPVSPRPSTDCPVQDLGVPSSTVSAASILKQERKKSGSFSSLSRLSRWFEEKKKKRAFDIKHFLKSVVEPLFSSSSSSSAKGSDKRDLRSRRPYSFSGNPNPKERDRWMKRRGEFSAPASMRTSPTNSGLLLSTPAGCSSSNESSMDELHNAIQAAIAHCKNSTPAAKDRASIMAST